MKTVRNLDLRDLHRPHSTRSFRRPQIVYVDPGTLYQTYPELNNVPVGFLKLQIPDVSRQFLAFPIAPVQVPAWVAEPTFPMETWPTVPSHIFAIPIFVSGKLETFHYFPIHDLVFMIMCPKLKRLRRSWAPSSFLTPPTISVPVVNYWVPAPYSFPLFQEHIYTMDYGLLMERFMGVRLADLEKDRDSVLAHMSSESLFAQATLINGFYKNVCHFGFHDEQTFDVVEICWNHLCRARLFQTGATSRFT